MPTDHWDLPIIVAVRAASGASHPASTKTVPIIAAYTLVLGSREEEENPSGEAMETREYTLWSHGDRRYHDRRFTIAVRADTLSPEGESHESDRFVEFDKNTLRFGEGKGTWKWLPFTPNWAEIGSAATCFLGPLYGPIYRPSSKIRPIPEVQTAKVLREHGMALYNLNLSGETMRFSLAKALPDGSLQSLARLFVIGPVSVGWKAADHEGRAAICGLPASGVDPLLLSYLREYGRGDYASKFPLNSLFSLAGLKGLFLEKMERPPRRASFKARLKFIEKWNSKPPGKGPFDDRLESNFRAWRAFGYPPRVCNLKLEAASIPEVMLQEILERLAPGKTLSELNRIFSSDDRAQRSKYEVVQLGVQLFAVSDAEGHCGVVFEGRLRWGFLSPDALERLDRDRNDRSQDVADELTNGKPIKIIGFSFNQGFPLFLHDFLCVLPDGTERPMQAEDFASGPWIEVPKC